MMKFNLTPFIKCVVLDVNLFDTKVVDECNFLYEDQDGMLEFEAKYRDNEYYVIIKIEM